ncbi:MAG: tetratricopeptide repeat protein [Phycisphaerae bacterium]
MFVRSSVAALSSCILVAYPAITLGQQQARPTREPGVRAPRSAADFVPPEPPTAMVHYLSSPHVVVSFQAAPGSGPVTGVTIWYTDDQTRTWRRLPGKPRPDARRVVFEASSDGLYGFFVVLHNAYGPSELPPEAGTAPHQWVYVDRTAPIVQIVELRPDPHFYDNREVSIRWRAKDENLPDRPVKLHFRSGQTKSYRLIADNQAPASAFRWTVPEDVSGRISVKVSVVDRAGNIGRNVIDSFEIEDMSDLARQARVTPPPTPPSTPTSVTARPDPAAGDVTRLVAAKYNEPPALRPVVSDSAAAEAKKRYDLGTWHRLRGEYALAMVRYREALRLAPDSVAARNDLAGLLFLRGKHDAAERELKRVLSINPRHRPSLKSLALVEASQRKYRSAVENLNKLLLIDDSDAEAWMYLGDVTMFRGDRLAAREFWTRARDLKTASDEVRQRSEKRLAIYGGERLALGRMEQP